MCPYEFLTIIFDMKKVFSFIGNHICRIIISLLLIAIGIHWGLLGVIPFFIVYVMWDTILYPEQ